MLKLFYFLQSKLQATELRLSARIQQRINEPYSSSIFYFNLVLLNLSLVFWQIAIDFLKFIIILSRDPGVSFNIFFKQRELRSCPFSYHQYKNVQKQIKMFSLAGITAIVIVTVVTSLVTNLIFGGKRPSFAASYGWVQNSWSGGLTLNNAAHNSGANQPQQNWNQYSATSSYLAVVDGNSLQLLTATASTTQTDDSTSTLGFNLTGSSFSTTTISGSQASASVKLTGQSSLNLGDGRDGPLTIAGSYNINTNKNADAVNTATGKGNKTCADGVSYNVISLASNTASLNAVPPTGCFVAGDKVMLANEEGVSGSTGNVGNYEILTVQSISGNVITFTTNKTKYYGNGVSDDVNVGNGNATNAWSGGIADIPTPAVSGGTAAVSAGDGNVIYLLKGGNTKTFYKYSVVNNSWSQLADTPTNIQYGGSLTYTGGDYIYAFQGSGSGGNTGFLFWRYSISGNSWTAMASAPSQVSNGGSLVYPGSGDYMYAFTGNFPSGFYRYSISGNSWTAMASAPSQVLNGGSLVYPGSGDYMYAVTGNNGTGFWRYSISGNSWTTMQDVPAAVGLGGSLIYPGSGDYMYAVTGKYLSGFYRYSISGNSWSQMSNYPTGISAGALVYPGYGNYLYEFAGNSVSDSFYKYSFSVQQRVILQRIPQYSSVTINSGGSLTAKTWDGINGGMMAIYANGTVTVNSGGTISMDSKGESNGGGFGGGYSSGIAYDDNLCYNGCPYSGIGGGYRTIGGNSDGTNGKVYGLGNLSKIFLGSSGGIGYGGGIIFLNASALLSTDGTISSKGSNGNAGSSGGSIYIGGNSLTLGSGKVVASGGADTGGTGGVGGDGRIYLQSSNINGTIPPAATTAADPIIYYASGNYTSGAIDTGQKNASWGNLAWTQTLNTGTIGILLSTSADNVTWTNFKGTDGTDQTDCSGGKCYTTNTGQQINAAHNGSRYIKYKAFLTTLDNTKTPSLDDLTIGYSAYQTNQALISSTYNTGIAGNILGSVNWTEDANLPTGTGVTLSLRSASSTASLALAQWYDFTNATNLCIKAGSTVNCPFAALAGVASQLTDGVNDQYFQYKVNLSSTGANTPTVSQVVVQYVINAPPELDPTFGVLASQNPDGTVTIQYKPRDPDTTSGSIQPGLVTPSFEYSLNNGSSWSNIAAGLSANATSSKAVDTDAGRIASGTAMFGDPNNSFAAYSVTWNPGYLATSSSQAKIRVTISDQEAANATAATSSATFLLDAQAPTFGALPLTVNAASSTAVASLSATDSSAFYYKLSLIPDLADANWATYTPSTSLNLNSATTVYVQFKDAFNNTSATTSVTLPENIASVMVQDTSNVKNNMTDYRMFIAWKAASTNQPSGALANYNVYRSSDSINYTLLGTSPAGNNYFTDSTADSATPYFYKIAAVDVNGNIGYPSPANGIKAQADGTQDWDEGGGGAAQGVVSTIPTITPNSVATSQITTTGANISWATDLISDSQVAYQTSNSGDFSSASLTGVTTLTNSNTATPVLGNHQVQLVNLTPATTYYFELRSTNPSGGMATSSLTNYVFTTLAGPVIDSASIASSTVNTAATITWNTDQAANSYVVYSTHSDLTNSLETGLNDLVSNHSVSLLGLKPNTQYYFMLKSANAREDNAGSYYTFTTTRDLTPPTISSLIVSATNNMATIQFQTAKPATSTITLVNQTDGSDIVATTTDTLDATHLVSLTGLKQSASYSVTVIVRDANDNTDTKTSVVTTLDAPDRTPPVISTSTNMVITGPTSAIINWTTDEPATSHVLYGLATSTMKEVGDDAAVTTHQVTINQLQTGQTYLLRLKSTDPSGNETYDPWVPFYTFQAVLAPLVITNPAVSTITDSQAVITWSTNQAADSKVNYGLAADSYTLNLASAAETTEHALVLTGLASSTPYFYKIVSKDSYDQTTSTVEYQFTTAAQPIDSAEYQAKLDQINLLTAQLAELQAAASSTGAASADQLASLEAQVTSLQTQLASAQSKAAAGGGTILIDKTDKTPPVISGVQASELKSDSAKISWSTNKDSYGFVDFNSGSNNRSIGIHSLKQAHSAVLDNLTPGSKYSYQVSSLDASGNLATSADLSFTTPALSPAEAAASASSSVNLGIDLSNPNSTAVLLAAAQKAMDIVNSVASTVSLGTLETTLTNQFDSIQKLANSIPAPIMGGEPGVLTSATTATITWKTDKNSSSLVAFSPQDVYSINSGDAAYTQLAGDPMIKATNHQVLISGLKPDTTYHYQLRSQAQLGPVAKSRDFTFKTNQETLEVSNYAVQNITNEKSAFKWITNSETDSRLTYIPYRNNQLAVAEAQTVSDPAMTTVHSLTVDKFEGGTIYQVELSGKDTKGNLVTKTIETYSTSKDDLPPIISSVQTESALSQGKDSKVQTIITWTTNEPTLGQIMYEKGVNTAETLTEKSPVETSYGYKHVIVITKFDPGEVYSFKAMATDSAGNLTISKTFTILTPRQKESVFQLILNNFEQTFGWVGTIGQ